MKVLRAVEMGMCFGVRDALQIAAQVDNPSEVTIRGELVHNPKVLYQLNTAGFEQAPEGGELASSKSQVLITAHGISDKERARLHQHGRQLIDTTCPLVRRAHDAAMQLAAEGRHVLLIGKSKHVEVQGITEDLERFDVIANRSEVGEYACKRLGIISQTTMPTQLVDEIRECIAQRNPGADIRFVDTVCRPTKLRQHAMLDLLCRVDVVVVVGGRNSNNTRRLAELCSQHNVPAWHVTCADEIDPEWFAGNETIGLTAGTSTLDETIDEVHGRLEEIAANQTGTSHLKNTKDTHTVPPRGH